MGLQEELDRETERLATSIRERREEEDEQIVTEVRVVEVCGYACCVVSLRVNRAVLCDYSAQPTAY